MTPPAGRAPTAGRITVAPDHFTFVRYDAATIARVTAEMAELVGVANPIHVIVDERTPLSKLWAAVEDRSSDAVVTVHAESGALEDTQRFTHFGERNARDSLGRMLLRARDRLRADFADVPPDLDLTVRENAAWDAYCAGRLARAGEPVNAQRWRYNFRNRFGFRDDVDAAFDRIWTAEDLSWTELVGLAGADVPADDDGGDDGG